MPREGMIMGRGRPFKCPYCGEIGSTVSKGVRRTKTMGIRRVRRCKACGRKFTPKNQKAVLAPVDESGPAYDLPGVYS